MTGEGLVELLNVPAGYEQLAADGLHLAVQLLQALLIFGVGWWLSNQAYKLTLHAVERRNLDRALGRFLAAVLQWTVLAATAVSALQAFGVEATSLLAVLASAGVAIGLALQGSLSHFASGVLLLVFRPFTIGDYVTVAGTSGTVDEIGLFATTLITPDLQKVTVPNSTITGAVIVNSTTIGRRRADVVVNVAYGADPEKVRTVLREAVERIPEVHDDPPVSVVFAAMGASALDFKIMAFCSTPDFLGVLAAIRTVTYEALSAEGIEIPFDQIVVHQAPPAGEAAAK